MVVEQNGRGAKSIVCLWVSLLDPFILFDFGVLQGET